MSTHFILFCNCKHLLSKFTSVHTIRTQSTFNMDASRGQSSLVSDSARADTLGIKGINLAVSCLPCCQEQSLYLEWWPVSQGAPISLVTFRVDLAQGEWSKTGSLPFCKVKMRSVTNKFSLKCMQDLKMLRGKKAFLINEDCMKKM